MSDHRMKAFWNFKRNNHLSTPNAVRCRNQQHKGQNLDISKFYFPATVIEI